MTRPIRTQTFPNIVPMLVGLVPTESVVISFLATGRVVVTARIDLAHLLCLDAAAGLAATVANISDRATFDEAVSVVYTADPTAVMPASDLVVECVGVPTLGQYWVRPDGRWTDLRTAATGVVDYSEIPEAIRWRSLSSRADIERIVAGPMVDEDLDLDELLQRDLRSVWAEPGLLDHDDAVAAAAALTDDACFAAAVARIDPAQAERWVQLAKSVITHAPTALAERPLLLGALSGWAAGDGVMMNVCLERLAALATSTPLVARLRGAAAQGLPPSRWEAVRQGLAAATKRS